eukprot:NODE_422_length_7706_cov_0.257229.p3 type:complete len:272 gc:universal NODE_422_length_7706_cov_0.257229:1554-2369(+)
MITDDIQINDSSSYSIRLTRRRMKLKKFLETNDLFMNQYGSRIDFQQLYFIQLPNATSFNLECWRTNPLLYYTPNFDTHNFTLRTHPAINNTLRLGLVNIQSIYRHSNVLTQFIIEYDITVCAVSETNINPGYGPNNPLIKWFNPKSEFTKGNGVAIYPDLCNPSINLFQILNFSKHTITIRLLNYVISVVYLPPRYHDDLMITADFVNGFVRRSDFVLGDFNNHFLIKIQPELDLWSCFVKIIILQYSLEMILLEWAMQDKQIHQMITFW